ncbi:cysteine desulfurase family protein [Sphingosinithalassobacter portus]|uniref:cysteine desulfurase family protein n=1 Tax=Stakelama portus TaxID=2676234 RepID=UPI000D6DFA86|nr:aminotransferase class V-fold PLP-dependent enzyme [Sphingosinithalassobacter portus]
MTRIYLDHAATTPMLPQAIAAVEQGMRNWANPSSPHAEGRAARAALEDARARIKAALGWDGELIFTSGASEALAIGLGRAKADRGIVSAVEHDAVFRAAGPQAAIVPMAGAAFDREALRSLLAGNGKPIVAIQHLNSETGTIQPLEGVADQVREAGGIFLSDCSQSAGKLALPDADMIVVSAHKLGGPPGIGALLVRDFAMLDPSGGQEFGYRGGTENLPGALGFAAAVDVARNRDGTAKWLDIAEVLVDREYDFHRAGGEVVSPAGEGALWSGHILAVATPGFSAAAQLMRFDMAGIAVSAGSACSSGTLKQSRTLRAFGIPEEVSARTIRVSLGWDTTAEEIDQFFEHWLNLAAEGRNRAA